MGSFSWSRTYRFYGPDLCKACSLSMNCRTRAWSGFAGEWPLFEVAGDPLKRNVMLFAQCSNILRTTYGSEFV